MRRNTGKYGKKKEIVKLGYVRVSSAGQEDGRSLDDQVKALIAAGIPEENIFRGVESAFGDRAEERKVFKAFTDSGKEHAMHVELVQMYTCSFSRWGRNAEQGRRVIRELSAFGIECYSLDDGLLSNGSAMDEFTLGVRFEVSQLYSALLGQRVKASLHWRRERKIPVGGKAPFGYVWNRTKTQYILNHKPLPKFRLSPYEIGRYVAERALAGRSSCGAATDLKTHCGYAWDSSALLKWLKNPTIAGAIVYRGQPPLWGMHEPIITLDERSIILANLAKARGRFRKAGGKHPLRAGMCRCAWCGKRLRVSSHSRYFSCGNQNCTPRGGSVRADAVEKAIIKAICDKAEQLTEAATSGEETITPQMQSLMAQRQELEKLGGSGIPEIQDAIARLDAELQALKDQQRTSGQSSQDRLDMAQALSEPEAWLELSEDDKRIVFAELLDCVIVRNKVIEEVRLRI